MPKISLIAKLTAADGKADDLAAALGALIDAAEEEAGLEVYSAHKDDSDPNVFWFFEIYADAAALDVHGKGDRMKAAMGALGAHLGGRPEVMRCTPIVAKGLSL